MKIIILAPFSYPSICGVWTRVYNDAIALANAGHEVHVFSSNIIKGTNELAREYEVLDGIKIHRFPVSFKLSENALFWNFKKELFRLRPDIIQAHVYRHPHSHKAVKYAKKLKKRCILTTHAPFVEKEIRSRKLNFLVNVYDSFLGKKILNKYDRIINITRWEDPYLSKLGVDDKKLVYIPNGISEEYFFSRNDKINELNVLFLGRVVPIKNLECLIKAISLVKNAKLSIVGPSDEDYKNKLSKLINDLELNKRISFFGPVYSTKEKIELFKKNNVFVLPSFREAMPQSLVEAMAAGLIILSSKTKGGLELIKNDNNGFLFNIDDNKELAKILMKIKSIKVNDVRKNGQLYASQFKLSKINEKLIEVYNKLK